MHSGNNRFSRRLRSLKSSSSSRCCLRWRATKTGCTRISQTSSSWIAFPTPLTMATSKWRYLMTTRTLNSWRSRIHLPFLKMGGFPTSLEFEISRFNRTLFIYIARLKLDLSQWATKRGSSCDSITKKDIAQVQYFANFYSIISFQSVWQWWAFLES